MDFHVSATSGVLGRDRFNDWLSLTHCVCSAALPFCFGMQCIAAAASAGVCGCGVWGCGVGRSADKRVGDIEIQIWPLKRY